MASPGRGDRGGGRGGGGGDGSHGKLTTAQYGAHAGVSDRTIRSYCRDGMPHTREPYATKSGRAGERIVIDQVDADAWRALHIAEGRVGGKREGAGRPRPEPTTEAPPAAPAQPGEQNKKRDITKLPLHELTKAELAILETGEKVRELRLKNEAAEGRLVPRDDVRATWTEFVIRACGVLTRLPEQAADIAARRAGLTAEQKQKVLEVVAEQSRQAVFALRGAGAARVDEAGDAAIDAATAKKAIKPKRKKKPAPRKAPARRQPKGGTP